MKKIYQATAAASICFAVLMGNVYAEENTAPVEIQKESENEQESDSMARQFSCFQIKLDGEEYSFPASVEEWKQNGWENVTEEAVLLAPEKRKNSCIFQKGEAQIQVFVENQGTDRGSIEKSSVVGMAMDSFQENDIHAELPGEIVVGVSSLDEIEESYGTAAQLYDGEHYLQLTYQYGMQSYLKLNIEKETEILRGIEIVNAQERGEAVGNMTVIPEEGLGTDLTSGQLSFDGEIYDLPAPVSQFLENGFVLLPEESDMELDAMQSGFAVMQKDNKSVQIRVENTAEQKRDVRECVVTSLESSKYTDGFQLILPRGIQLGMTQEELEGKLDDADVMREESDHFIYYGILADETELDETAVFVEKETGLVVKIQIER